uniref:STAS domain-containing protein n=1 Tax=Peronospora matthiolae TaxID=2874970 RepID=A0AAV1U8M1_9STRA
MATSSPPMPPRLNDRSLRSATVLVSSLWTSVYEGCRSVTRAQVHFFLKQYVPILEWLPAYDMREDLQYDVVSGVTVGLMLVPQEVSLSAIMGVPPIYGLYTAAVVPMIYPLFGTSRVLSVANGAEVSLLVGSAIKKVESEEERIATGIVLSFLSGLVLVFMGVFRLGVIADFFSRPVMGGFLSAGGVLIMLSQVASWLGLDTKSRDLPLLTVLDLFQEFTTLNVLSFVLGTVSILVLVGMHELKRKIVTELANLAEEVEDQFAIETSRALNELSISTKSVGEEPDGDVETEDDGVGDHGATEDEERERAASCTDDDGMGKVLKHETNRQLRRSNSGLDSGTKGSSGESKWAALPLVSTTGSIRRREDVLTASPWEALTRRSRDITAMTRSTRHARMDDEGVGFSLSDEHYITVERPLDFGSHPGAADRLQRSDSDEAGLARTRPRMNSLMQLRLETPRRAHGGDDRRNNEDANAKAEAEMKRRVKELVSPAKSDAGSEMADSSTALTGRMLAASSTSVRLLRSKMALLVALRLVCDLGAFMVCLLGGIVGYLAPEGSLALAGDIPGGYPSLKRPWYGFSEDIIDADRLYHLFIDTLSIAIISYMCSVAMAKRLAIKEGYRIRPNQELLALGFSNLVGSFFQGMPSTGGLSRTAVNMQNARTQLASVITVLVVVTVLYTATSALAYLPKASLASIIIVAGYSLIELKEAKWLYRVKRDEFYVWLASFVLSCLLGVLPGLLSSIFCSLVAVIYKTRRPIISTLGEVTDEETQEKRVVDLDLYPDTARPFSDVVAIRVEGALYFANCEYIERVVEREVRKRYETEGAVVRGVVIDAGSMMDWDTTTIQMMKHLKSELRRQGIMLAIVNARDRLQLLLKTTAFLVGIVHNDARIGFVEAITAIREEAMPPDESGALTRPSREQNI